MAATTTYQDTAIGIRAIPGRTDSAGSAVTDISAEEERFSNILFSEGWIAPSDAFEPVKGSPATWEVIIGSGAADVDLYVVEGQGTGQGNYVVRLDQTGDTITVDSADVSNPRTDEIYLVVLDDAYDSSGLSLARFAYRKGDAAPGAPAPGPGATWKAYALIATVLVPASSSDIIEAALTDERVQSQSTADAPTLEGVEGSGLSSVTHNHNADYAPKSHENATSGHPLATTGDDGFMSAADKAKLNAIESLAEVNLTPTEVRALLLGVDGAGSGLDADLLDGVHGSGFSPTSHVHDGDHYTETEVNADLTPLALATKHVYLYGVDLNTPTGVHSSPLLYESRDDWGGHSGNNNYITVDRSGYYYVSAYAAFDYNVTGMRQISIAISGTTVAVGRTNAIGGTLVRVESAFYLTAGQGVYMYTYQNSGGNLYHRDSYMRLTQLGS